MSWRDQMQKGTFRGVPFGVKSQDTEGGRRVVRHEYPGRDDPWPEDLGRKARTHSLEMHVIGSDYMAGRDAMLDALEQSGPAELVHPWLGRLQVQLETYRLRESTREGGMATFSVTFTEAGKQQFPTASADTASVVDAKADVAMAAVTADFSDIFSVLGQPGWVADAAVATMNTATTEIKKITDSLPGIPTELTSFYGALTGVQGSLNTLVLNPANMANGITGIISGIADVFADPLSALKAYQSLGLFGDSLSTPPSTTPARKAEVANQQASVNLNRRAAVIEEARTSSRITPSYPRAPSLAAPSGELRSKRVSPGGFTLSSAAAILMRDDLADRLDSEAETASDDVYLALMDLRAAVVKDMTERAAKLPQIGTFTPHAMMPALVLAHRIHGDASRDGEIVARNNVRHPGFVPGGSALEYLT